MKKLCSWLFSLVLLVPLFGQAFPSDHLKLYASFDRSSRPEIARDGCGLHSSGPMVQVSGKWGKALHFPQGGNVGDLWYRLGTAMKGPEWTLAMWIYLDRPLGYGKQVKPRNLFRTDMGWNAGNVFAGFDSWGHFGVTHLDASDSCRGVEMSSQLFPIGEWTHLACVYAAGRHQVYINGIEANYQKSMVLVNEKRKPSLLRLGSMDFRAGDQLDGRIDELMIFDRALAAGDIRQTMDRYALKGEAQVLLYVPFDGAVDPVSEVGFSASQVLFAPSKFKGGVKLVRHGYDRLSRLFFRDVPGLGGKSVTVGCYFTPEWDGRTDQGVHGLFHAQAGDFGYSLAKRQDKLIFSLRHGRDRKELALPASCLKRGVAVPLLAGFDLTKGRMFVSAGSLRREASLAFGVADSRGAGSLLLGDTQAGTTYSATQAEGIIDELLVVNQWLDFKAFDVVHTSMRLSRRSEDDLKTIEVSPVKDHEKALWSLEGAETHRTPTREKVVLNALWRMQLTSKTMPFNPKSWMYLAVPGRYSGQHNSCTDSEFYLRDSSLRKLPRNERYGGVNPYSLTSGWFERAFRVPSRWQGKQLILLLDELSRSQKGILYLNGKELVRLKPGCFFEIPLKASALRYGEDNFLTIHAVDSGSYWAWRGIKGDVWLEAKPFITLEYPAVITSVKHGTVTFEVTIRNHSSSESGKGLTVSALVDGEHAPAQACSDSVDVASGQSRLVTVTIPWKNARQWSPQSPYLYGCQFSLKDSAGRVVDVTHPVRFGFREFELRGKDYFLNGKKVHLFNHDSWINSTCDLAEAKRWVRVLKSLGYNSVRTNFPADAKDSHRETIMQACDEEGLLQLVGLDGVTGREYALWNNPAVRQDLKMRMEAMIRRWRNHPSIVVYFLSTNYLGYGWDYHPLIISNGYVPEYRRRQASVCLEGVSIMRGIDSTRPYFFQAGGNFGEIITSNAYFCWWPQAERNGWPELWSKHGQKPLHIIETEFPIVHAFYGMDLHHQGNKPLFYYENLARYYGPEAYLDQDAEMHREVARSTEGKSSQVFYDAPMHQRLRSKLLRETIHCWRGYDMSGICPFAEIYFAFKKHAPHRTQHVSKVWEVEPGDFRRSGWHPDLRKIMYGYDVNPSHPLPVAQAFKEALAPRLVLLGGPEGDVADRTHSGYAGEEFARELILVNDTEERSRFRGQWSFASQEGVFDQMLQPGEVKRLPLTVRLPMVTSRQNLTLTVKEAFLKPVSYQVSVFPKSRLSLTGKLALYDVKGMTETTFEQLRIPFVKAQELSALDGIDVFIIGRESLSPDSMELMRRLDVSGRLESGRLNVMVMEQRPESLALLGMRSGLVYARDVFAGYGDSPWGLQAMDFRDWAGSGTLAPSHEPPSGDEAVVPTPLWHWSNRNMVCSYPLLRPTEGACRVWLSCGKDLIYTPLCDIRSGEGTLLFCQLEISGRTRREPAAEHLLLQLLKEVCKRREVPKGGTLLTPEVLTQGMVPDLMEKVHQGAVLLAPPNSARLFGLESKALRIRQFELTSAGRRIWGQFTARDMYLRGPQGVQALSGQGLIPLTSPSFAAVLPRGKGKVIFLEVSATPQAEELSRGLTKGKDSSVLWSACRTIERFRQMKNQLLASHGYRFPSLSRRFSDMCLPQMTVNLAGDWLLRTDSAGIGLKRGWHLGAGHQVEGWERMPVPGYFNHKLPQVGEFIGHVWYRKSIELPPAMCGKRLYLELGAVDDLDDTYVNGVHIGHTGEDTPGYWMAPRHYEIPARLTAGGTLHLAIRTENLRGNGGICDYARLVCPVQRSADLSYPYGSAQETYHTETHVRW